MFVHLIHPRFTDLNLAAFDTQLLQRKLTTLRLSSTKQYLPWRRRKIKEIYDFKAIKR